MSEIEEEINHLPQEKKKAYTGEDEELSNIVIQETVNFSNSPVKKE